MAIELHQILPLFVRICPEVRDRLVAGADDWLHDDGTISYYEIVAVLTRLVVERFDAGDYGCADDLFALVERLLSEGSQEVKDLIATGFLEGLLYQQELPSELWVPLIGPQAREYLLALNSFHGTTTPGLEDPH
jgi:hypothetical protein